MCFVQWIRLKDCKSAVRYPDHHHPPHYPRAKSLSSIKPSRTIRATFFSGAFASLSPPHHSSLILPAPTCISRMPVGSIDSVPRDRLSSEPATVIAFELSLSRCLHHAFYSLSLSIPLNVVYARLDGGTFTCSLSCPASMP